MKVKRNSIYALALSLMCFSAPGLVSCSDDEPVPEENKPEVKPDEGSGFPIEIPQEVLEKVNVIYGNASTGPQEVTTVSQLAILTSVCAARNVAGPITVTSAQLNGEDITLVTLGGTEFKEGQATTLEESKLAAMGKENDYLTAVTGLFKDGTVPQNKPVIVTGISLGGMIAQQILGQKSVTDNFDLRAVITFGSPITLPLDRKGVKVVRFADVNDQVPTMGELMLRTGMVTPDLKGDALSQKLKAMDEAERVARTSKYKGMVETHALSYIEDACWTDVDFMGSAEKNNVLELKEDMKFYPAPQLK